MGKVDKILLMPGRVSYSVGREKTTLPEGESKKASCRRWHLSQDLRKDSREKHYRDRKLKTKAACRVRLQLPGQKTNISHPERKVMEKGFK